MKKIIGDFLVLILSSALFTVSRGQSPRLNYRFDGWYNNPAQADWGTPGRPLTRIATEKYVAFDFRREEDFPHGNPRMISEDFMSGESGIPSTTGSSLLLVFFGQHLVDEIVDTRRVACPNQYMNVQMSDDKDDILPFYKSKFVLSPGTATPFPTTPVNEATSWVDGSAIYGGSTSWSDHLREFQNGRLKTEPGYNVPPFNKNGLGLINPTVDVNMPHPRTRDPKSLLAFGNPRGNENIFLMTIGIVFFRYHNYNADEIARQNPDWSDEKIFTQARRLTVATYQNIMAYEWLPYMTGLQLPAYSGYNRFLEPGISVEFSTAAMRVGHSMVPIASVLRNADCTTVSPLPGEFGSDAGEPALRLCNTYWKMQTAIVKYGIDEIVRGMASQPSEKIDHIVNNHLRNFLYGPVKRTRMDIETLTIQRGRDHGLPMYNTARHAFGLPMVKDFNEFSHVLNDEQISKLREIYHNNTEHIDIYVGGMLESRDGNIGELFGKIIHAQIERLRDSDRFWFENTRNGMFSEVEIRRIRNTTLFDVILATTNITENDIQQHVFNASESACEPVAVNELTFLKNCSAGRNVDLFQAYWGKYAVLLAFLVMFPVLCYILMTMIAWNNRKKTLATISKPTSKRNNLMKAMSRDYSITRGDKNRFKAVEIEGVNSTRSVKVELIDGCIRVCDEHGRQDRNINILKFKRAFLMLSNNKNKNLLIVRLPKEYDLVFKIAIFGHREKIVSMFLTFFSQNGVTVDTFLMTERELLSEAVTKEARKYLLEKFFRDVFLQVLAAKGEELPKKSKFRFRMKQDKTKGMADCELSINELADMLGMTSDSLFVQQMFNMADTDRSGYLSMREFTDLTVLLMDGSPEQKVKLLFDMYDTDKSGSLERDEGEAMIRSFLEVAQFNSKEIDIGMAVTAVFDQCTNKDQLTLDDFTRIMLQDHRSAFQNASIAMPGLNKVRKKSSAFGPKGGMLRKRRSAISQDDHKIQSDATENVEESVAWRRLLKIIKRWTENYRRHIFCMVLFYTVTIALLVERAEHYTWHSEHTGIRRVTAIGIVMSRATAAAISFHYTFILLTMCRNIITALRETFLNAYIPFDSAVEFHKHVAYLAIIETAIHVLGHLINVYHFSVHPLPVLACVFPKILVDDGSDMPKTFIWWAFQNITGVTGVLLVLVLAVMYVFAMQYSRRYCFRAFWWTHNLFVFVFVLTILHGSVGLIQEPLFHIYLVVPGVLYLIDKLIMVSRSKIEINVIDAKPLPSNVLNLVFKRPEGFDYRSGQWVRIACLTLGNNEYHPFTLTSAPHEEHLSLHIRSVGPWTNNLRDLYKTAIDQNEKFPKLYLDGPFGEGHQDWYKYDVAVLVGAGIGVTPFASILKDIVQKNKTMAGEKTQCQKVYFIWVTRTQRHFEWLTDIIKEVEANDLQNLVDVHIYITQFQNKFDLRTTMLYICERYFQKIANTSLFTGLKAMTHFGRPKFDEFLNSIQYTHATANRIGVFSCGPPGLTKGVESACKNLNHMDRAHFIHYYENF